MQFNLPSSVEFGGKQWPIRTDYRGVLRVLAAFEDPDLTDGEKVYVCLKNLYPAFEAIPPRLWQEAFDAAARFIDGPGGVVSGGGYRTMDWEQDAPLIFPAVNRVAGFEVRTAKRLHWWTFLGYFMEIRDSTYATVLALRQKRARGQKLEKEEAEFWRQNAGICELRKRLSAAEIAEKERLEGMLGK